VVVLSHIIGWYLGVEERNECTTIGLAQNGQESIRHSMSETHTPPPDRYEPGSYEIRLRGHLDGKWAAWFEGLTITLEDNGDTLLTGPVTDQAALHGLLRKVRDLGMPLVSVRPLQHGPSTTLGTGQADQSEAKQ
jgi:hypothetical protein